MTNEKPALAFFQERSDWARKGDAALRPLSFARTRCTEPLFLLALPIEAIRNWSSPVCWKWLDGTPE